jgi:hypothetical protein
MLLTLVFKNLEGLKSCGPYSIIHLDHAFIFEWCVLRHIKEQSPTRHVFARDWTKFTSSKFINHSRLKNQGNWRDIGIHLKI